MYSVRNLNNGKKLVRFMNESVDNQEIYINTREELDELLQNYPSGAPRVVIGEKVKLARLFEKFNKNIDISNWDVSNVRDMNWMFINSNFNGDISNWDVSNVERMYRMFENSKFNGDISNWDVSNVRDMGWMFAHSKFNGDISNWNVLNSMVIFLIGMYLM